MAQVPYSPVPDVVPTAPAAPKIGVSTPPAAFGITTAEAMQRLGGQAGQSSNEMFQTALGVKQLENETWAKNDYVNRASQLSDFEEEFRSKKGMDAVNFRPQYEQNVRGLYQDAIANAPNPQAARFLGDVLSRRVAFSLEDAGRHAGQQRLAAVQDASVSNVAMGLQDISKHPDDDKVFGMYMGTSGQEGSFEHEARVQESLGNGKAASNLLKWQDAAWKARFEGVYDDPQRAQDLYDRTKDQMVPSARAAVLREIKNSEYTIRAVQNIATAQSKQEAEAHVSDISSRNRIVGPDGQAGYAPNTVRDLTNYARQNPSADKEVEERLKWVRQANEDAAKGVVVQTNQQRLSALTGTMFDPDHPTRERDIAIAENDRQLSGKDRDWLLNTIKLRDMGDKEALKTPQFTVANNWAKNAIEGSSAADKQMNAGRYAAFQTEFLNNYLAAVQDKKLEPNDLDVRNPDGLLRKTADKYVPGLGVTIPGNGGVAPPAAAPAVPPIKLGTEQNPYTNITKAERDALEPGTKYTRPEFPGSVFTKEGKVKKPAVPEASM